MKRSVVYPAAFVLALAAVGIPAVAAAQTASPPPSNRQVVITTRGAAENASRTASQVRYQISLMEAALERAVGTACQTTTEHLPVNVPMPYFWGGSSRVRGFRLDGYGLFFDVEIPILPATITWSLETLTPSSGELESDLASLREQVGSVPDPQLKRQIEQTIKRLEVQLVSVRASSAKGNRAEEGATTISSGRIDPTDAYVGELKTWLSNAMLDRVGALPLGPDEWLTVAARTGDGRVNVMPSPSNDTSLVLRIKGADLEALKAGKITREEARKRIEMAKEF